MHCTLCQKLIANYSPEYNHLVIDETHDAEICAECIDKFVRWQRSIFARLYPTKAIKKMFGKKG